MLTPGAVILPHSEHLLEQLEWVAEDIVQREGDAYVLPVTELTEADEEAVRRRMQAGRRQEYNELREAANRLARGQHDRRQFERELATLRRGLARTAERDHFSSAERSGAERAIRIAGRRKEKE